MASTLPRVRQSMPLNSLAPRMAKASIAIKSPELAAESVAADGVVSLVFECLAAVGMADKEAAYTMAMDPAQLSRIKNGQGRLPIDALWRLPDLFWFEFRRRVDERKHLTAESEKRARVARIRELVGLLVEEAAS